MFRVLGVYNFALALSSLASEYLIYKFGNIWMVPDIKLLLLTPKTFFAFGSLSKSDNL